MTDTVHIADDDVDDGDAAGLASEPVLTSSFMVYIETLVSYATRVKRMDWNDEGSSWRIDTDNDIYDDNDDEVLIFISVDHC